MNGLRGVEKKETEAMDGDVHLARRWPLLVSFSSSLLLYDAEDIIFVTLRVAESAGVLSKHRKGQRRKFDGMKEKKTRRRNHSFVLLLNLSFSFLPLSLPQKT